MKVIIQNEMGLHARPAAMLVSKANQFEADIFITKEGQDYNAKSIMNIMTSAIVKGDEVEIKSSDSDAVAHIVQFLEQLSEK